MMHILVYESKHTWEEPSEEGKKENNSRKGDREV
jgi:hypothetical protein